MIQLGTVAAHVWERSNVVFPHKKAKDHICLFIFIVNRNPGCNYGCTT